MAKQRVLRRVTTVAALWSAAWLLALIGGIHHLWRTYPIHLYCEWLRSHDGLCFEWSGNPFKVLLAIWLDLIAKHGMTLLAVAAIPLCIPILVARNRLTTWLLFVACLELLCVGVMLHVPPD
jgi:hypothetical protein